MPEPTPVILLTFANDLDDRVRYLRHLSEEARRLRGALEDADGAGRCQMEVRQNATRDDILNALRRYRNRVAIFHYGGHAGSFGLLLETPDGHTVRAHAAGLAAFLAQQRGLLLVFLNGCSTQAQIQGLLDAGVSVVIATAQSIDDGAATEFAGHFYRGLASGATLGEAYEEAVGAMRFAHGDTPRDVYTSEGLEEGVEPGRWPWELAVRPGAEDALAWRLPEVSAPPPVYAPTPPAEPGSVNSRALREFLTEAFDADELRALVVYDENLKKLQYEFARADSILDLVDKTMGWCERRVLTPYLIDLARQARPDMYKRFEAELFPGGAGQPPAADLAATAPEIYTISSPIYLSLVRVPAGEFLMGSVAARDEQARDDEFPAHRVHLPEFHIGQYLVTNAQYQVFAKATEGGERHYYGGTYGGPPRHWERGKMPPGKENHPVVGVHWRNALSFCAWLSEETGEPFRLPTEAEWEKAARGADGRIYPWGDQPPDASLCNFGREDGDTTPIGRYSPLGDSPYGCADMAGNVFEWTSTAHDPYPYQAGDGREEVGYRVRVIRGGAYSGAPLYVRCASRYRSSTDYRQLWIGFRVARGPAPGAG